MLTDFFSLLIRSVQNFNEEHWTESQGQSELVRQGPVEFPELVASPYEEPSLFAPSREADMGNLFSDLVITKNEDDDKETVRISAENSVKKNSLSTPESRKKEEKEVSVRIEAPVFEPKKPEVSPEPKSVELKKPEVVPEPVEPEKKVVNLKVPELISQLVGDSSINQVEGDAQSGRGDAPRLTEGIVGFQSSLRGCLEHLKAKGSQMTGWNQVNREYARTLNSERNQIKQHAEEEYFDAMGLRNVERELGLLRNKFDFFKDSFRRLK